MGLATRWLPFELHPETPAEGAPKPFTDAEWPAIQRRLRTIAATVGIPIEPPRRNVNSRRALEACEAVRARAGDAASAAAHHALSRAFFVDGADIGDARIIAECVAPFGVSPDELRDAWAAQTYANALEQSMRAAMRAGVTGVPAFGPPGEPAIGGMMEPERIVALLVTT